VMGANASAEEESHGPRGCWNTPTTPAPPNGRGVPCRRCCSPATMPRSHAGGARRRRTPRARAARTSGPDMSSAGHRPTTRRGGWTAHPAAA
jgi:hypothetical protein